MRNIIFILCLVAQTAFSQGYYSAAEQKVYDLNPADYGIVQGVVDSATALNNRYAIEQAFQFAKDNKYKTLRLSNFDAFFEVATVTSTSNLNFYPWVEAVNAVSGLNLDFRDNVTFRTLANKRGQFTLFSAFRADNVTIKGGTFIGDRFTHDESLVSDQRGYCIKVLGSKNLVIDGATTINAYGDGMVISSRNFTYSPDYIQSKNIILRNNLIQNNRRQGISVGDGNKLIIENNQLFENGTDISGSLGSLPRCAIDIEAQQRVDADNNLIYDQYVSDVIIRGNHERGSGNAGILMHTGDTITIENNITNRGIVVDMGSQIKVLNNQIIRNDNFGQGLSIARENRRTYDNLASGNYISGFSVGINVNGTGTTVIDNEVYNTLTGLRTSGVTDGIIRNNIFESTIVGSRGLYSNTGGASNTLIENNTFKSDDEPLLISSMYRLKSTGNSLTLKNNQFISNTPFQLTNADWVEIAIGNTFNVRGFTSSSDNLTFKNSSIISTGTYALDLRTGMTNTTVTGNTFEADGNPVKWDSIPVPFTYTGNTLNGTLQN